MSSENPVNPVPPSPPPREPAPSLAPPPAPPVAAAPRVVEAKSGFLAGFLSFFVPGLGHLYLGAYQRAAFIFGALVLSIMFVSTGAWPFGFAIAFLWFFGIIDSVRLARAMNLGLAAASDLTWDKHLRRIDAGTANLTWGVILVGLGALWLIDRYTNIDWSFMHDWGWAVIFILLGLVLIATHIRKKRRENESGVGMPPRSS